MYLSTYRVLLWFTVSINSCFTCVVTVDGHPLKTAYLSQQLIQILEDPGTDDVQDLRIQVVDKHKEVLSDTE